MKLSASLSSFDALSRRLALRAAARADALVRPAPARTVKSEVLALHSLGADAWPGPVGGQPDATLRGHARDLGL